MSASSIHADAPPSVVRDPEGLQYETGPHLGKGGFAICHRAKLMGHDHLGSSTVALKIVKSKMEPPKLAQKFVTELQIHSKLSHPNIVEFYRAFSFETSTYVVLELCENGSLADAIKKRKYFTMPEIRRFMIQTCGAIKYLHQRNIVHRDLKTGNLFLDRDMNVKVGDFGLAALLVSQSDYGAIRRTTMCGTPNYLAPEVLEKTGKGHDEKVDLWAIGIMMYTLAVGRAPFHAAKREDIYRKLKACDYTWPDLAKFANEITDDLRDIVSLLLVHEDERPTPDQIVAHPFFKLGFIPLELESACTSRIPKWSKIRPPTASTIKRGYTEEWWTMCKASAVGEYEPGKSFGAYGSRRNKAVAKDCQKEIEAGKQPNIPFAKDCVYVPFPARVQWPHQPTGGLSEISEEKETSSEGPALTETTANERPKGRLPKVSRKEQTMPTLKENAEPVEEPEAPKRMLDKQPTRLRAIRKISNPGRMTAATAIAPAPLRVPRDSRTTTRTRVVKETSRATETGLPDLPPLRVVKTTVRASAQPEPQVETEAASQQQTTRSAPRIRTTSAEMPATDPVSVLARLHVFRDNLARALEKKTVKSRRDQPPHLPFVSKWVDYSRRYGVGYVLDDGTIGTLLTAEDKYPVTAAFALDGYTHLRNAGKNREQAKNVALSFYTTVKKDRGLTRIEVLDKRRVEEVRTVWHKFGRYMCASISDEDAPYRRDPNRANFVKFYQRLGSVGIWGFEDGAFQVNFPDHTKLVLSADAAYGKFICLPVEAALKMEDYDKGKSEHLPWKYVKTRAVLKASLHKLLYGTVDQEDYKEQTEANLLREKIEFIHSLVSEWCQQGGLGCLAKPRDHVWEGPQLEETKRLDWASVGRYGGDVFS
ncbi:serine/threonine-protein kinase [Parastagonospora nodorum]|uniref:Serine/threonine-protein kinase n=1 Tax=Phaeosphaeria nodorum (strain SN15 / ATCC MYA-4574 / FGSC 10173) TaxID=321614 RepID=A0A7U2F4P4_PHANO|nr:serine/threonine-protein kinase [Parastagonospora nodorum]QRC98636.1 serine/threonine-protein kinase [Parastagonospora nodorum SN15]KAH3936577.1 serine/threonine-protein kinase [Parastagonospora nodorum]KAH3968882.1 serine/threonine-protein kinase [Parastagonospora nodorum]KAH3989889.1 serine/threonine-protein kinase [Parastagonospora nodorum]